MTMFLALSSLCNEYISLQYCYNFVSVYSCSLNSVSIYKSYTHVVAQFIYDYDARFMGVINNNSCYYTMDYQVYRPNPSHTSLATITHTVIFKVIHVLYYNSVL